jgi:4-hydroxysphinganine ceramide fatty acyl 2-hydroxylase
MSVSYKSTHDETVRLFQSDFLEFFTRVHPSVPVLLYMPFILWFLYRASIIPTVSWMGILAVFLSGAFTWSFMEYLIHRFIFHFKPKGKRAKKIFYLFHGIHHDYPNDSRRLVMPPVVSLPIALTLLFLLFGKPYREVFLAGFGVGYLSYDMIHYAVHHFLLKRGILFYIKQHHLRHHFKDATKGFGVSSSLWDLVFKT